MGNAPFILAIGALWVMAWWNIFSKAGFPGAFSLLMLVPILNVFLFLMLAFFDWPAHAELAQLRDFCRDKQRRFPPTSLILEAASEPIADWLAKEPSAGEMFDRAATLDQRGDWADAITIFDYIAEKLKGQQDGQYAWHCAEQIREKMKMSQDA